MSESGRIEIVEDAEALALAAATWLADTAAAGKGRFAVALSGGSTPRRLYELLAESPFREKLPWDRVHWFWGDERFVPWDHPDSNYGMAQRALLSRVRIPAGNVHGIPTTGTPSEAARTYQAELQSYYRSDTLDPRRPLFDVQLLGLGPDGHTASLFPNTAVLREHERWVAEVVGAKPEARITLTYPALESSRHAVFLVAGAEKRAMFARVRAHDRSLPAARLKPVGELLWFVDHAAAGRTA